MALRITAHTDTVDGVRKRCQGIEKVAGVAKGAHGGGDIAADDKHFVDIGAREALQDLFEMTATAHQARGKMRHDGKAGEREALGHVE